VTTPPHLQHLPLPPVEAREASTALARLIAAEIESGDGWMSFARYMELALYAPGLGYYSGGSRKLGSSGDFVTAPELTPLFGRVVARQIAEILALGLPSILELGGGTGALAAQLLAELAALGRLPERYCMLEVSAELRERQQATLAREVPEHLGRVHWLDTLPAQWQGVILANEVLDAMPVHRVRLEGGEVLEVGVVNEPQSSCHFGLAGRPARGELLRRAQALELPPGYDTEIPLAGPAFINTLAGALARGVMLLIDYGFPQHEFYHPQRRQGTLMCHYRHHAHADPFALVGLQDITAHVDFSAIARAGAESGLDMLGYASQAQFLINCGITDLIAAAPREPRAYTELVAHAQKLLSPAEMGELFKVIALGKGIAEPLLGFAQGDKSHTL
jgi:SAM-dependent MidA family methyltransferase